MDRNEKKKDEITEPVEVSLGGDLRKARLKKDISLESIANSTKINIRFLEAIEEDNYDVLPRPYIRAFIIAYARALNIPPEDYLKQLDRKAKKHEPVPTKSGETTPTLEVSGGSKIRWTVLIVVLVAVILIIAQIRKTYFRKDDTMRPNASVTDTVSPQSQPEELPSQTTITFL